MSNSQRSSPNAPGEWVLVFLLGINLIWTTLCLGGYRPETMVVSWGFTGAAVVLHLAMAAWAGEKPHPAGLWMLPFLVYAGFNVFVVTPVPWLGRRDWLGWAQPIAIFWIALNGLRGKGPRLALFSVAAGLGVVAVALAAYQRFLWPDWLMMGRHQASQYLGRSSGPFGNPNSLGAFFLVLIPPLLALTWQRGASAIQRILCGYLSAVFLLGLSLSISRGAMLALMIAMAIWPLFLRKQNWAIRGTLSLTALALVFMAGLVLYTTTPRIRERFDALASDAGEKSRPILWRAAWQLFQDAPILGTGAGSFNVLFERYRPAGFRDDPQWAHNEYVNTLSDYGALGFVLLFGAVAAIAFAASRADAPEGDRAEAYSVGWRGSDVTRAGTVGLLAFALSACVDFHLKIPALAMMAALFASEVVRRNWAFPRGSTATLGRQLGLLTGSVGVLILTLALALPTYRAEAARYSARETLDRLARTNNASNNVQKTALTEADADLAECLAFDERNGQAWADRAYTSSLWSHLSPNKGIELGQAAEASAREAIKRSEFVADFWIRLGVALDMQGRWAEAGKAFAHALGIAPANPWVWYYQSYHLSLLPSAKHLAIAAIDTCLRLDPGNRSGIALRQSLSSSP